MNSKAPEILVIDNGLGNAMSVAYAFQRIGENVQVEREVPPMESIGRYALTVLPGVGSFDKGMQNLQERGWVEWLQECVRARSAVLGLCLGMQLLCEGSDEGVREGLGLIPGKFVRFAAERDSRQRLKVPHMGWNFVRFNRARAPWSGTTDQPQRFYFVHSFYLPAERSDAAVGWTDYGQKFASVISKDRLIGLQFHPEKSHRFGTDLLRQIVDWARA